MGDSTTKNSFNSIPCNSRARVKQPMWYETGEPRVMLHASFIWGGTVIKWLAGITVASQEVAPGIELWIWLGPFLRVESAFFPLCLCRVPPGFSARYKAGFIGDSKLIAPILRRPRFHCRLFVYQWDNSNNHWSNVQMIFLWRHDPIKVWSGSGWTDASRNPRYAISELRAEDRPMDGWIINRILLQ